MNRIFYAHSLPGRPVEEWQLLEEHLENVSKRAAEFARPFDGSRWARLLGYHHDIGKGTLQWQSYLRHVNQINDCFATYYSGRVPHALVGAQLLYGLSKDVGKLLAYCIAGHHGGLPNWDDSREKALKIRLYSEKPRTEMVPQIRQVPGQLPLEIDPERFGFQIQFFVRMIFSCLVDADFLDTERALNADKARWRSNYPAVSKMRQTFWNNFNQLRDQAQETIVNRQREIVLNDCLRCAEKSAGLFSLTVPTGGGKTLASMAFALEHAVKYHKRRIIYVIPFTSIIEQNAAVFQKTLGNEAVLEHHCNFVPDEADWRTRLASENWDAPVVVTTNVQFFDSFFARRPSRCRKLHNVADSVIIFDEVQAIPVEKLGPCLEVIRELTMNYKVTALLCTATQPAIHFSERFQAGLKEVREIVSDVPVLFDALRRTRETFAGILSEQELADSLVQYEHVLCIVNFRRQALDVFAALPASEDNFHLSALMYPAHRSRKLADIRRRLEAGRNCRVVSTQLIEAGVDVDFECVFRAAGGIDSIAQAAGRCNRNGRSKKPCDVFVFKFSDEPENSIFRQATQSAQKLFDRYNGELTSPDCVQDYFLDYFWKNQHRLDADGTLELCKNAYRGDIQFKDIAAFEMINTATTPVVIALEEQAIDLVRQLEFAENPAKILRKLQQYSVQIYPYQLDEIRSWLENPYPGVWILRSPELYSEDTGLKCKSPGGCAFFG